MLGAIINKLIRILPMVTEGEAREQVIANGDTTQVIAYIPTIHARELVVMVSSDVNVTLVKRIKGGAGGISVDRTQAVAAGVDFADQDTSGLGQEVELLITNASGDDATVDIWAAARM
jgi:hypothetical protein